MDQKDLETINLKDPDIAWAILTPSPHLTDYPVDDLHALYLVYVGQCWQPPLSRTQCAWRREHISDGKFKYAVIDARFEYKGRSLYERAILYVGNEAAIAEEILNGTAPTYYALKPEDTDSTLLIHTQGQEIPRESASRGDLIFTRSLRAFLTVWGQESTIKYQFGIIPGFRSLS